MVWYQQPSTALGRTQRQRAVCVCSAAWMQSKREGRNVSVSLLWASPHGGEPPSHCLCWSSVISSRIMLTTNCAGSRAGVSVRSHLPIESGLNHHPALSAKGHSGGGSSVCISCGDGWGMLSLGLWQQPDVAWP